jgi:hypothetical protein
VDQKVTDDDELLLKMRELKEEIDQKIADLTEPKAAVNISKEQAKQLGLHRAAFDLARKYANRKLPEAQAFFDTVDKCGKAFGIFDQGDLVREAQRAPKKPVPTRGRPRKRAEAELGI